EATAEDDHLRSRLPTPWQVRAIDHLVQPVEPVNRIAGRSERIVGPEQNLVRHVVLLSQDQAVVELPGPIVERRKIEIQVRMLPRGDKRLALIRMTQMREDHL